MSGRDPLPVRVDLVGTRIGDGRVAYPSLVENE